MKRKLIIGWYDRKPQMDFAIDISINVNTVHLE